jgi:hypothetical protein
LAAEHTEYAELLMSQQELGMRRQPPQAESSLLLAADLVSAKVLVWFARVGRDGELTPEAHSFFADRYQRLADSHRRRGHLEKAERLRAKASYHLEAAGGSDGPPYAAALAMPRPARFIRTNAVGTSYSGPPDAA